MLICTSRVENYLCDAIVDGHTISSDSATDKGGMNSAMRPHQLLEAAYACCLNMTIRMFCDKHNITHDGVCVKVILQRFPTKNLLKYSIDFDGNLSQEDKFRIIKAVDCCPVRQTLEKPFEFTANTDI